MDLRECSTTVGPRHPWEVNRAHFFRERLVAHAILCPGLRVLDVGAGDAYLASVLLPRLGPDGAVLCYDAHYQTDVLEELRAEAHEAGARALVTTEKDLTRLGELTSTFPKSLPLMTAQLHIEIADEGAAIDWLMDRVAPDTSISVG